MQRSSLTRCRPSPSVPSSSQSTTTTHNHRTRTSVANHKHTACSEAHSPPADHRRPCNRHHTQSTTTTHNHCTPESITHHNHKHTVKPTHPLTPIVDHAIVVAHSHHTNRTTITLRRPSRITSTQNSAKLTHPLPPIASRTIIANCRLQHENIPWRFDAHRAPSTQ
jgi:hypothetical protein